MSKAAIEERRSLNLKTRQEVEAVCANSSLSGQQKRQQIQQIHHQEREQLDSIITPGQQEAMRSCQQERNPGHAGGHVGGVHGGPCGETPTGSKPKPLSEDESTPADETKPN